MEFGNPRLERLLNNAALAAKRGSSLTQRLLSFTRQRDLTVRLVDANQIIRGMEDLLLRTLGGVVQVEQHLAQDVWPTLVDPDQLELAVLNLAINARDAMPEGGMLTLTTRNMPIAHGSNAEISPGDYVAVSVRDSGTGMSPEVLARVFEPFFTTKSTGEGTGLGLSMVYGFAQRSGGAVRIESRLDRGTTVEMLLPRASAEEQPVPEAAPVRTHSQRRVRVLVVDDNAAVRDVTVSFLRELGHTALEASSGQEAFGLIQRDNAIDLVIADFAMPVMNGTEFARQARSVRRSLPILLVTGHADRDSVPDEFPVLYKPFDQARLAAEIALLTGD